MFNASNDINKILQNSSEMADVDIDGIMANEVHGLINYGEWLEVIKLQKEFNNSVADGWEQDTNQSKFNYWMAIMDESVEVLGSRQWKWWKDSKKFNQVDWDNVRVEMIDLFHFILSIGIQTKSEELIFASLISGAVQNQETQDQVIDALSNPDKFFEDFWEMFLLSVQLKAFPMVVSHWVTFWTRLGFDVDDLFNEYRIKAALNKVRQEFGYGAKNNYNKQWPNPKDTTQLVEDNVAAWSLHEIHEPQDTEEFIKILRKYYVSFNR